MKLFIGSANLRKVNDWKEYFPAWEVLSYAELGIPRIEVEEGFASLEANAEKKALAWAKASGEMTLSDDTGFFVPALGGRPGVSVKRWGGRFKEEMDALQLLRFLEKELAGIEDTASYFETVYVLALPTGETLSFADRLEGAIDKSLFAPTIARGGGPLGCVFRARNQPRAWREMTPAERREAKRAVIGKIEAMARELSFR